MHPIKEDIDENIISNLSSSLVSDLISQNRTLTRANLLYDATCRSTAAQLKTFLSTYVSLSPSQSNQLVPSTLTKSDHQVNKITLRLADAERLIQVVAKTLDNIVETQQPTLPSPEDIKDALPLTRSQNGHSTSEDHPSYDSLSPIDASHKAPKHHQPRHGSFHRSPSPSPKPRSHISLITDTSSKVVNKQKHSERFSDFSSDSEEEKLKPKLDDEVAELVHDAVEKRDLFWRGRIRDATETQTKLMEAQIRQCVTKRFSHLIEVETEKLEKARVERDSLRTLTEEQETTIADLKRKVAELLTEVEAGMRIIHQFSELMKDKASSICQYCRRSGTLKMPPLK